jgi:hypothetical protein
MALATLKLVDFLSENVPLLDRMRSLLTFVVAIVGVWAIDYSVFAGLGVSVRNATLGTWVTGFIVAGMTVPWRAVFGYLTHDRAAGDETLGAHGTLRSAA